MLLPDIDDSRFSSYERLLDYVRELGQRGDSVEVIGEAPLKKPIVAVKLGGERRPPLLIAAGAHSEESGGVFAALRLLARLDTEQQVYIVPCRDPLGWHGVRNILADITGETVNDDSVASLRSFLDARAHRLCGWGGIDFYAFEGYDTLAFTVFPEDHPGRDEPSEYLTDLAQQLPGFCQQLAGRRLLIPSSPKYVEGRDTLAWGAAPTIYIDRSGRVGNMNRFFDSDDAPDEVRALRTFVDRIQPELTLDLHEGWGRGMFFYVSMPPHMAMRAAAFAGSVSAALHAEGVPLYTLSQMDELVEGFAARMKPLAPGAFTGSRRRRLDGNRPPAALGPYSTRRTGMSITTEPGMERHIVERAHWVEIAARAAVRAFEDQVEFYRSMKFSADS